MKVREHQKMLFQQTPMRIVTMSLVMHVASIIE